MGGRNKCLLQRNRNNFGRYSVFIRMGHSFSLLNHRLCMETASKKKYSMQNRERKVTLSWKRLNITSVRQSGSINNGKSR